MDKKKLLLVSLIVVFMIITIVLIVKTRSQAIIKVNPAFREYVAGFTSGVISTESTIKVRLNADVADSSMFEKPVEDELFSFSPGISGKTVWIDTRTVEFRPEKSLPANTLFTAKFYLHKVMQVPDSMRVFVFQFHTAKQAFEVDIKNMKTYDGKTLGWMRVSGVITTADAARIDDVREMITASQDGRCLKIIISPGSSDKSFNFVIDSVKRTDKASTVKIDYNGKHIGSDNKGSQEIVVPSLNDFLLTSVNAYQEPENFVSLQFSDPILPDQDLAGMIRLGDVKDLKFTIDDNEVRIYPATVLLGTYSLTLEPTIRNINNRELGKKYTDSVTFEDVKPDLRLVGNGVILPSTNGLIFPFEAINLRAVDVKIFKIYENNIAQYLQVNDLSGDRELTRVGKVVLTKTVPLRSAESPVVNFKKWNRFYIDLSELIDAEPGAIYKVSLSIKKEYSLYKNCEESGDETAEDEDMYTWSDVEDSGEPDEWYYYDYYGYYYDDGYDYYYYDWYERDDPCEESYYRRKTVSRNVLATDIAILAKIGSSGDLNIYTSDIITAKPLPAVSLKILDYQSQQLYKAETNSDGMASIQLKKVPYLIIAEKGGQKSYLKLTGGSALSLSMFDVSGEAVRKGIKGFLYAERGVWRPGDSIYLMFILEDKLNRLSPNTPVIFNLTNPRGQKVQHIVKTTSVNGFYDLRTATDPGAPTGYWTASVQVGGSYFSKTLRIETIKPNRLKIKLDFGTDKITKESKGTLEARWLHGAIARNLKADITLTINRAPSSFPKFAAYCFDDPSKRFYSETYKIFDASLDKDGKAQVFPDISLDKSAPGVLKANFMTRVFEQGGAFSIDQTSLLYYPYSSYVGIRVPEGNDWSGMLNTNKDYSVGFVNIDMNGKPITSNKVTIDIFKVKWRWWWDASGEDLADFVRSEFNEPYKSYEMNVAGGKGMFNVNIPDADWGRYLIRITDQASGHSTGQVVYFDWPDWASRSREGKEAASMLIFKSDKEKYAVGEEVKLTIPSSEGARALISIETGSKVLESEWIETTAGQTQYSFKVTEEMAPNIYVNVTLVQPHSQTVNDMPIRLYGVIPVLVEDPQTHLRPVITMNSVLRPEENATINIREENGKAMTYTVAVVDEGLLDLTGFKTPDPWNYFYAREALGVKSWDVYDYVMGAYGGQLERILSIGGGDDGGEGKGANRANRFVPMVKFFGPFALKKGASNIYTFKMPQYVGSVRVMVIAGQDGAYGSAEKTVQVRKPLMLLATLPRVLSPGETVALPVSVFAMEKNIRNVTVKCTTNEFFSIEGTPTRQLSFLEPGDDLVTFNLKVKEMCGVGKVKVYAACGSETAVFEIEIDIRNPNPEVTDVLDQAVSAGKSWNTNYTPVGIAGTNIGVIEVSSIPPLNLEKRLSYLVTYPYGCIEQTTSSAFPQLYLSDLMDLDDKMQKRIERNIKSAISKLSGFQTPSGGLAYWPGAYSADEWGTTYAGHFLLEAREKGYTVSTVVMGKWEKYQKRQALAWTPDYSKYYINYDLLQAYRLYTLALAKKPELGAMNLLKEQKNLSLAARWRLAAAYQLAGHSEVAKLLVAKAATTILPYREMAFTYGSDDRDRAMIVEALTLLNMKTRAAALIRNISDKLSSGAWMSTQSTAYCLLAISKWVNASGKQAGINVTYSLNNGTAVTKTSQKSILRIDMNLKNQTSKGKVKITNNGSGVLFARVILKGVPAAGEEKAAENNLKIAVNYTNEKGEKVNPSKLEQGTDFIAEVQISNPGLMGFYYNMALSQIFASGWEIHNTRMDNSYGRLEMSASDYQDFRDDRVNTFFSLGSNTSKTYRVLLNASYLGRFYLPSVICAAMYDDAIYARTKGEWVEVVPVSDKSTATK